MRPTCRIRGNRPQKHKCHCQPLATLGPNTAKQRPSSSPSSPPPPTSPRARPPSASHLPPLSSQSTRTPRSSSRPIRPHHPIHGIDQTRPPPDALIPTKSAMKFASAAALAFALLAPAVRAQDDQEVMVLDTAHNATSIGGTWSSGSQAVVTGSVSALFCCLRGGRS